MHEPLCTWYCRCTYITNRSYCTTFPIPTSISISRSPKHVPAPFAFYDYVTPTLVRSTQHHRIWLVNASYASGCNSRSTPNVRDVIVAADYLEVDETVEDLAGNLKALNGQHSEDP